MSVPRVTDERLPVNYIIESGGPVTEPVPSQRPAEVLAQARAALQHIANQGRIRPQDTGHCAADLAEYAFDALVGLDDALASLAAPEGLSEADATILRVALSKSLIVTPADRQRVDEANAIIDRLTGTARRARELEAQVADWRKTLAAVARGRMIRELMANRAYEALARYPEES